MYTGLNPQANINQNAAIPILFLLLKRRSN